MLIVKDIEQMVDIDVFDVIKSISTICAIYLTISLSRAKFLIFHSKPKMKGKKQLLPLMIFQNFINSKNSYSGGKMLRNPYYVCRI